MKASELIEQLESLVNIYGDHDVVDPFFEAIKNVSLYGDDINDDEVFIVQN
jgi:hypothetical protein